MKGFRPSLWSTLALIAVGSGLLSLGFWQIDRYGQQQERKALADAALAEAPWPVASLADLESLKAWRRVALRGQFVGHQGGVVNKYMGGVLGHWLVAPFRLKDGTHIVVMRGWVPESSEGWAPPKGSLTVSGILQDSSGDLAAAMGDGNFRSLDGYAILADFGLSGMGRVLIEGERVPVGGAMPEALPRRGFYGFVAKRPHLEYAGTWFGLALALLGVWIVAGRKRAQA